MEYLARQRISHLSAWLTKLTTMVLLLDFALSVPIMYTWWNIYFLSTSWYLLDNWTAQYLISYLIHGNVTSNVELVIEDGSDSRLENILTVFIDLDQLHPHFVQVNTSKNQIFLSIFFWGQPFPLLLAWAWKIMVLHFSPFYFALNFLSKGVICLKDTHGRRSINI